MVSKAALRRRPKQGSPSSRQDEKPNETSTTPDSTPEPSILEKVRPHLATPVKMLSATVFGLLCAGSLQSETIAMILFVLNLLVVFTCLFLVFYNMLAGNDLTPIEFPTVYQADGTVIRQSPMSVLEHDKRVAQYYSAELPMLGIATAWFHLWTRIPGACMLYGCYTAYRIINQPIFRIHVFKDNGPGTERPFGIAPLFKEGDSRVKIVAGSRNFHAVVDGAKEDTLVIVDVSAPWCGPCQALAPIFRKLADEFPTCTFITIDVDVSQDLATELAITSVPSIIFFQGGQRLELLRGGTEQKLREAIRSHM